MINDGKWSTDLDARIAHGEALAAASLASELLICQVAGVKPNIYIGRNQFTYVKKFKTLKSKPLTERYACPSANWWAEIQGKFELLIQLAAATNDQYMDASSILLSAASEIDEFLPKSSRP